MHLITRDYGTRRSSLTGAYTGTFSVRWRFTSHAYEHLIARAVHGFSWKLYCVLKNETHSQSIHTVCSHMGCEVPMKLHPQDVLATHSMS